jgi:hypothetical protein
LWYCPTAIVSRFVMQTSGSNDVYFEE